MLDGDSDQSVLALLQNAQYYIGKAASISPELSDCVKKIQDAAFTVSDVTETLSDHLDALDFSEEEYDAMENRIAALSRLFRKYNRDEEGLLSLLEESEKKLDEIRYSDALLEKYSYERDKLAKQCLAAAGALHARRVETAEVLQERIEKELRDLNMPGVRFLVGFEPVESGEGFNRDGSDKIRFLMSANAGEDPGKISRVASGGELSRIMLALKNVFSEKDPVPTQVFDEIDAGVSGIAGQRVAEKLYNVAVCRQVMCVTHLPQIAAMADAQYRIEKQVLSDRTYTRVQELDTEGRILELARLYGGDNITAITKQSAEEQLAAAEKYKKTVS
jgi:DNA repair protein RecN (Recombination protein N)